MNTCSFPLVSHRLISPCLKPGVLRRFPITDLNGLIYIAYFANCDFSHSLRASSAAYFAADRQNTQPTATVAQLENALDNFPNTLEKLWKVSGIVNKSQVKQAILRDFVENRDYIWAGKKLCVSDSTFHILAISFRSLKGSDVQELPEIIQLKTREYFKYQADKKMNRRLPQDSEWMQPNLF